LATKPRTPHCQGCEGALSQHASDHIESAYMCVAYGHCELAGLCLTCQMLGEWFRWVEGTLTA